MMHRVKASQYFPLLPYTFAILWAILDLATFGEYGTGGMIGKGQGKNPSANYKLPEKVKIKINIVSNFANCVDTGTIFWYGVSKRLAVIILCRCQEKFWGVGRAMSEYTEGIGYG